MVDYLRGVEREGGKLVWDKSMEKDTPKDMRRGIVLTGNEGVSIYLPFGQVRRKRADEQKTLDRLRLSLHMLRNVLKCTLPIEMYHFTGELEDPELRAELEATWNLVLIEVTGKRPNGKSWSKRTCLDHMWLLC
jgi:alpha 1,2-mannosyltransferase